MLTNATQFLDELTTLLERAVAKAYRSRPVAAGPTRTHDSPPVAGCQGHVAQCRRMVGI